MNTHADLCTKLEVIDMAMEKAYPENLQGPVIREAIAALQAMERVPMTTAAMVNVVKAAGWPTDTNDRQLVAAFNLIEATEAHHNITPPESI